MIALRALVPIARDLAATFVFVALFFLTDIFIATACGITLIVAQTAWSLLRRKPIGALHWLSLALISMLGGATILFHWPYFIMIKPSILWLVLGVVMLRRDWIAPYLPAIVTENLDDRFIVRAGYAFAAMMFALAIVNLIVVWLASQKFWAIYALVGPTVTFAALLLYFYFRFRKRILVRIRRRKAMAAEQAA